MLHKIPIPIPTPKAFLLFLKLLRLLKCLTAFTHTAKRLTPTQKTPKVTSSDGGVLTQTRCKVKMMCNVIMDNFIDNYAVEAAAGTAPTQAEGEAIC